VTGERWICKFCGEELTSEGECLNRAGQVTLHHPDTPEWNGSPS
jgi:hypothetical protein